VRFWDSSALMPLVVGDRRDGRSKRVRGWIGEDPGIVLWTLTEIELRSGLARLSREGHLEDEALHAAARRADELVEREHVVEDLPAVKARAKRLLMVHRLRAADALQLAAALVACGDQPGSLELVTFDERLSEAARREGLTVRE